MTYDKLQDISEEFLNEAQQLKFVRTNLFQQLNPPKNNVVLLKGARGIGKSTLLKQFLASKASEGHRVLYVSADNALLNMSLAELAFEYNKRGGIYLAIDEIHKASDWELQVKTIVDSFSKIKLIASGSSSLSLDYAVADLSRRLVMVPAQGLSLREFIEKNYNLTLPIVSMSEIIKNYLTITKEYIKTLQNSNLDIIRIFDAYIKNGYFLSKENYNSDQLYYNSLTNSIHSIIESDIPSVHIDIDNIGRNNMKLMLKYIADKCPFMPNINQLSRSLNIGSDSTIKKYLHYLDEGEVLTNLYSYNRAYKDYQKPHKIFLNNTNYVYAFSDRPNIGSIRETYVANCLRLQGQITAPEHGDFCLDDRWIFEVGGRNKDQRQIKHHDNAFVLADGMVSATDGKIPLWLLGFLW